MTKEACQDFPTWMAEHNQAFEAIKSLVVSWECLTTINHDNLGDNKVFVTCDMSDWWTGSILSVGTSWETAHPMAFDSMQLKGAKKNYPVHEKELLAILHTLKEWRSDLLGIPIQVYTNHQTLQNFNTQWDLSCCQLWWQELMSQYDMEIIYIPGEDNTMADALSHVPDGTFPGKSLENNPWPLVNMVLTITTDPSILHMIQSGYTVDEFCKKIIAAPHSMPGLSTLNGLWYIGDRLLILHMGTICEDLFWLTHDTSSHFGTDKSYATLRDAYYWPNMRWDLEHS